MKYLKYAVLVTSLGLSTFFWLPALSSANDCSSNLINWSDYDRTLGLIQESYHRGDYQTAEQSLDCLLESNKTFKSGKSGAIAVYWFFRQEMPGPGADEEDKSRIQNWKKRYPNPILPSSSDCVLVIPKPGIRGGIDIPARNQ